jgi:hypothetical protein
VLQVNQSSGDTVQFNLEHDADRKRWENLSTDPAFQGTITGASILWGGRQYAAPRPSRFHSIHYECALILSKDGTRVTGEVVTVQADSTRYTVTVWRGQNGSMKVECERAGRRVHNPGVAGAQPLGSPPARVARTPHTPPEAAPAAPLVARIRSVG